ncbi:MULTISPECIES: lasso peptide biosynthesis B2 protein [Sphingopyxis]|jgi:hypothetical protein|nr:MULTISPECIES: lasso peptide biosynthesis B2 protein [Sphingopyxis]MBR2172783.1 lasso peptide biosynthesis B2 protein [Sphingopyxis sp.]MDR7062275.1 hypothetical protein [Sphingopyxis sp. BE235]MDR7182733.1 hypothetical protein [Sphingopyxis sp. BE249]
MMSRPRTDLRYSIIGADVVCLDLTTSRYFLLQGAAAEAFKAATLGTATCGQLRWLVENNLVEAGPPVPAPRLAPRPETSAFDNCLGSASPWTLVEALAEQWRARRSLARQSLGAILKPSSLSRGDLDRCQSTAAAFVRAWRYRNATDQCLVRSIAMRAMLARRGLGSDLVIGVMLPFSAHCWIQVGAAVLSDPLDLVVNYQPLLTVR